MTEEMDFFDTAGGAEGQADEALVTQKMENDNVGYGAGGELNEQVAPAAEGLQRGGGELPPNAVNMPVAEEFFAGGNEDQPALKNIPAENEIAQMRAQRDFALDSAIKMRIEQDVQEIAGLDPQIGSMQDIKNCENYPEIVKQMQLGNSLVQAYKLANFERLTGAAQLAGRQATLNSINGKSHLRRSGGTGGGLPITVPLEVLREYHAIMPDMSDLEIQNHYNKYMDK